MDFYRSRQPYEELPEGIATDEESIGEQAHQKMAQCLRPMFECLPEKYRTPLMLAELDGRPQQEIADKLGLSLSGAKSRVQRGRVKFKEVADVLL